MISAIYLNHKARGGSKLPRAFSLNSLEKKKSTKVKKALAKSRILWYTLVNNI